MSHNLASTPLGFFLRLHAHGSRSIPPLYCQDTPHQAQARLKTSCR